MSNRDDLIRVLSGEKPAKIPLIFGGFSDEKSTHTYCPDDTYDENTYYIPSDDPPRECYSAGPRTTESRERAVRMARYLDMATLGVGKGGVFPFGHGGPGEIQPRVVERGDGYKILEYEGGHRRRFNYDPHSIRYYHFPVRQESDMENLELPDMTDPARFKDVRSDADRFREAGYMPTGAVQGFFSGIHNSFMGFEDVLANLLLEPAFMHRLTERLARMTLPAVEMLLDRGVEMICVCDDLGNAEGLIISPELFRSFFLPWYEELSSMIHRKGAFLHMHSHGNIAPILPDLVSVGVDMINPFDWNENPGLPGLVKRYSGEIVFCGGVQAGMYQLSPAEVRHIVNRACDLARPAGGGYALMMSGPTGDLSIEDWEAWRRIMGEARQLHDHSAGVRRSMS